MKWASVRCSFREVWDVESATQVLFQPRSSDRGTVTTPFLEWTGKLWHYTTRVQANIAVCFDT